MYIYIYTYVYVLATSGAPRRSAGTGQNTWKGGAMQLAQVLEKQIEGSTCMYIYIYICYSTDYSQRAGWLHLPGIYHITTS